MNHLLVTTCRGKFPVVIMLMPEIRYGSICQFCMEFRLPDYSLVLARLYFSKVEKARSCRDRIVRLGDRHIPKVKRQLIEDNYLKALNILKKKHNGKI